jgi:hypothetical protein
VSATCEYPSRCGSDGERCVHPDCNWFSDDPRSTVRDLRARIAELTEALRSVQAIAVTTQHESVPLDVRLSWLAEIESRARAVLAAGKEQEQ